MQCRLLSDVFYWADRTRNLKSLRTFLSVCAKGMMSIDHSSYQLNFYLGEKSKITTFEPKVVKNSARNIKIYKIFKLRTAAFSSFYNILRPNFAVFTNFKMLFLAMVMDFALLA